MLSRAYTSADNTFSISTTFPASVGIDQKSVVDINLLSTMFRTSNTCWQHLQPCQNVDIQYSYQDYTNFRYKQYETFYFDTLKSNSDYSTNLHWQKNVSLQQVFLG